MSNSGDKKTNLEFYLDKVDYGFLNSSNYVPKTFSLKFMNFIKLVNGERGESHNTPPMHLSMLDKIDSDNKRIVNLCHRGASKTTIMMEYLTMYLAVFNELPSLGTVNGLLYVADSMDKGAKNARKNIEFRFKQSEFMRKYIIDARFTDEYLEFTNINGSKLGVNLYGAKSGLRGTKIFGKRPKLGILDDLLSDDDARSPTVMNSIKDIVYRGMTYALDPVNYKVILSGTPFNTQDIMVQAVESGAWDVNVYPVCERFPCRREDFRGSWEDRFSYDYVKEQYETALAVGDSNGFFQELMLRLATEDTRLIADHDIRWYAKSLLLQDRTRYNFYITTDFAVSEKNTADYTVISVWAYNSNGDWFWVDGICMKQTMDKTVDDLFSLVQEYKPQAVGVEISGQQGAIISWLQKEQMRRNIWFSFASNKGSSVAGIRPIGSKLARFNLVVPLFKAGKIYFPQEMRTSEIMGIFMGQIKMATIDGIKGHDDALDTISMLGALNPWKPYDSPVMVMSKQADVWEDEIIERPVSNLASYVV